MDANPNNSQALLVCRAAGSLTHPQPITSLRARKFNSVPKFDDIEWHKAHGWDLGNRT